MAPLYAQADWYDTPRLYDIVFRADTEREAEFLTEMQARHGDTAGRCVLEPACGSGRLVVAMAARGWQVTGFDASQPMLDYAATQLAAAGLQAELGPGRLESFAYPTRFDLAHCLVSTFKYLLDAHAARAHLAAVSRALLPGGLYVLGLHLSNYSSPRCSRERWFGSAGGTDVMCHIQTWPADRRARTEAMRSRLTVREGGKLRRAETHWHFRSYDAAQLRALLADAPELELVATYDFSYELDRRRELDDRQADCVLVLRRRHIQR